MISDAQLYTLAIFLGSAAMLLIVLYHFLEVNAQDDDLAGGASETDREKSGVGAGKPQSQSHSHSQSQSQSQSPSYGRVVGDGQDKI